MASRPRHRIAHGFALALLFALPMLAHGAVTVLIDGAAYPAQLRENTQLPGRLHAVRAAHAIHYEGELTGIADSWIRVSNIRGRWQGVVALNGARFVIDARPRTGGGEMLFEAHSPNEMMSPSSCAADATAAGTPALATQLSSGVAAADFATVCQSTVDGVCLLGQLDLAFDLQFQDRYPLSYEDQGAALLNIVDGYYRNDLNIQFDTLSMTFLTNDLFSTTTDANALLDDITNKKNAGQVPFVTNARAILHFVSGRDFAGTTVGIANVGSLCSPSSNTGTTQIVSSSTGLTALVIAHEIGHNFGANHDGTGNSCTNGFIMSAQLSQNATHFSSCSISDMTAKINSLPNLGACFTFPVDAALAARPGNPTTANANEDVTFGYDLTETHASVASSALTVTGSFAAAGGTFVSATLNGVACALTGGGQGYSCSAGSAGGLIQATVRMAGGTTMNIVATVTASTAGGVKDIDPANNTVSQAISTTTAPVAPSGLTAAVSGTTVNLTWQDNSTNEDGFRIERRVGSATWSQIATTAANAVAYANSGVASGTYEYRVSAFGPGGTSSPTSSVMATIASTVASGSGGGGGGGGGSSGMELVVLMCALFALRRRRAVASLHDAVAPLPDMGAS